MTGSRRRRSGRARKGGSISSRLSGWVNGCLLEPVAIAIAWKMLDDGVKEEEEEERHSAEWHECVWERKEEGKEPGWDRRKERGGGGGGQRSVCLHKATWIAPDKHLECVGSVQCVVGQMLAAQTVGCQKAWLAAGKKKNVHNLLTSFVFLAHSFTHSIITD